MSDVCECGHVKIEHAEFVDNQHTSKKEVTRRHCLHGPYDQKRGKRSCECPVFRPRSECRACSAEQEFGIRIEGQHTCVKHANGKSNGKFEHAR